MHISTHAPGEHGQTDERKQRGPEHIPVPPRAPGQGCAATLCRGNAAAPCCDSFHGGWEIKRAVTRARRGSKLPHKHTQNEREAIFHSYSLKRGERLHSPRTNSTLRAPLPGTGSVQTRKRRGVAPSCGCSTAQLRAGAERQAAAVLAVKAVKGCPSGLAPERMAMGENCANLLDLLSALKFLVSSGFLILLFYLKHKPVPC